MRFKRPDEGYVVSVRLNAEESRLLTVAAADLKARFAALADRWHDETDGQSSPVRVTSNVAYLAIIGMGEQAIPLILGDLRDRGGYWYPALRAINEADNRDSPDIPPDARGSVPHMTQLWLTWGVDNGYLT